MVNKNTAPNSSVWKRWLQALGQKSLPGFKGVPLSLLFRTLKSNIANSKLADRAAATTYFFLMAFPPTLLFLFTLIPYLPLRDVQETVMTSLVFIIPDANTYHTIYTVLDNFLNKERTDLLSVGVLAALYFSSNGMMSLMRAFDRSHPIYIHRSGTKRRLMAIKLTLLVMLSFLATMSGLILQSAALDQYLQLITTNPALTKFVSQLIILGLIYITISIIYRYGPSIEDKLGLFSVGSMFATLSFVAITIGFFFIAQNFINYDAVYGPIGSLIAFMIWMFLLNNILLLGYELNISVLLSKRILEGKHNPNSTLPQQVDL